MSGVLRGAMMALGVVPGFIVLFDRLMWGRMGMALAVWSPRAPYRWSRRRLLACVPLWVFGVWAARLPGLPAVPQGGAAAWAVVAAMILAGGVWIAMGWRDFRDA